MKNIELTIQAKAGSEFQRDVIVKAMDAFAETFKSFFENTNKKTEIDWKLKETSNKRTLSQNSALHLLFRQVADECVKHGVDRKFIIDKFKSGSVTGPVDEGFIKELVWKSIQVAITKKDSSAELTKEELSKVADFFVQALARWGVEVEFPSMGAVDEFKIER